MTRAAAIALAALAACSARRDPAPAPAPAPVAVDARGPGLLDGTTQLVIGIADAWDATTAILVRYERRDGAWAVVGEPVDAALGAGGLGWGRGLHGDGAVAGLGGPVKREGDDRSPAGAFRLLGAFGTAAAPVAGAALPYQRLGASWRCVDDPASAHYNRVFDARGVHADWTSAEEMRAYGELYRWVIEVDHNAAEGAAVPGAGSCVFLHVWREPGSATVGCTAMARGDLEALLGWLRPGAVYVLLPRAELLAVRDAWGLP